MASTTPRLVTEQTIREESLQTFRYGFHAGDEVILEVEAVRGRSVRDISFARLEGGIIYSGHKERHLRGRRIQITETGIYELKIRAGGSGRRIYRLRIDRLPSRSAPLDFTTDVVWGCVIDSSYALRTVPVLTRVDTGVVTVWSSRERVGSVAATVASSTISAALGIEDPTTPEIIAHLPGASGTPVLHTRTIGWSFAVATAGPPADDLAEALRELHPDGTVEAGLGAVALGATPMVPRTSRDVPAVQAEIYGRLGRRSVLLNDVAGPLAVGQGHTVTQGPLRIRLSNADPLSGIDVEVDVVAVIAAEHYRLEEREELVLHERPVLLMWGE